MLRFFAVRTSETQRSDRLPYPDCRWFRAAEGWLELGNPEQANRELDGIAPEQRSHPAVLALRWNICVQARDWDGCLTVANSLVTRYPHDACSWLALAQTHCFAGQVEQAYEVGKAKVKEFPGFWPLFYDTACYACLLQQPKSANWYLHLAMSVGDASAIRQRAQEDPDLAMLWVSDQQRT